MEVYLFFYVSCTGLLCNFLVCRSLVHIVEVSSMYFIHWNCSNYVANLLESIVEKYR